MHGDRLKVRVSGPPVDGKANKELVRFVARYLGVSKSAVTIRSGAAGRRKDVDISGLSARECLVRLRDVLS